MLALEAKSSLTSVLSYGLGAIAKKITNNQPGLIKLTGKDLENKLDCEHREIFS